MFAAASRSCPESAPCSCRPLSHETLLWHHRLGHPSLPRLRARVRGQGHERYFLLVVDDYSCYTTVFPLCSKGEVSEVLIDWIRSACRQLSESFSLELPVQRLHSDRGGDFSSDLLRAFCRAEGIRHSKMGLLSAALACTWRIRSTFSLVSPCQRAHLLRGGQERLAMRLRSVFEDLELLSVILHRTSCPPVPLSVSSLASPLTHPGGSFTTPPRVVFCPLRTSRTPPVDPLPPQGPAPLGVSQVDPVEPVKVAVDSGAARGAEPAGAGTGGAEPGGADSGGAEPGGADSRGAASWGAEPACARSGGSPGVPLRREPLSPQRLREWYARRCR
ncbi:unnamed protein product, partial [Closterium sp. NIES-53]